MYKTAGFGYLSCFPKPFSREMLLLHSHLGHQCHLVFAKIMNNMLFILNPYTHTSSLCCMVLLGTPPTSFLPNFRGSPFFFSGLTAGPTYRPLVRHSNPDTPLPFSVYAYTLPCRLELFGEGNQPMVTWWSAGFDAFIHPPTLTQPIPISSPVFVLPSFSLQEFAHQQFCKDIDFDLILCFTIFPLSILCRKFRPTFSILRSIPSASQLHCARILCPNTSGFCKGTHASKWVSFINFFRKS